MWDWIDWLSDHLKPIADLYSYLKAIGIVAVALALWRWGASLFRWVASKFRQIGFVKVRPAGPRASPAGRLQMWLVVGSIAGLLLFCACIIWLILDLRSTNAEIQSALRRYVLPRHLTEQQIKIVSEYLLKYDPQEVKFIVTKDNEECSSYRADFQRALEQGGWKVTSIDYSNDVREGISTNFVQPEEKAQVRPDPKHPNPDILFNDAFKQARVPIGARGSGSGIAITKVTFTVSIGRRRMDDGDLIGKRAMRERALRTLQELNDE